MFGFGIVAEPPPPPPVGCLNVTIDAPTNIESAIQWTIQNPGDVFVVWFTNGYTTAQPTGNYNITFRSIAGWATPASQQVSIPANSTNTFSGTYSFVSLDGDYQGLFSETSGPKYESCGFCEMTGSKGQSFTGKILCGGSRYSYSGKFDSTGNAWSTIPRAGASPLSVHLVAGDDILTGEISNETWTATILAKRNTFDSKANPASQAGNYTFALLGGSNSANQPGGDSFGTMAVDRSGGVTSSVTLSDGTRASQKTILGKDGTWPFYVSLYSGKGFAFGWLQLQSPSDSGLTVVHIFPYCDYGPYGDSDWEPSLGDYDSSAIPGFLLMNNYTWSVRLPYDQMITVYTNDYFGGTAFTITTNDPCIDIGPLYSLRVGLNLELSPDFGNITWLKLPEPRTKSYSAGFTNQMQTFVSLYQPANNGLELNLTNGSIIFQNGDLSQSITNGFSADSDAKISGPNKLNVSIAGSSGSFKGNLMNPLTGKVISFYGVVLQRQHFGRGFFLDGDQSGNVYFGP